MTARCPYCARVVAVDAWGERWVYVVHTIGASTCAGSGTLVEAEQIAPQVRP